MDIMQHECPVFLPDGTLCKKAIAFNGLCREHSDFGYRRGTGLGFNLIVKNEANCLTKTLENIKPYANEITITDTGSSDATVEIALQYADKV